ncbi:MAG: CBS domain-containing protein [Nitrospiraceae bacterium]|nr:CBS domain-containing protein [Nitrospiraceae bacterium]
MKVNELLKLKGQGIISMDSSNTVEDAIKSMNARKISALVITEEGRPVGMFTERDVIRCYVHSGGKDFSGIPLKQAMTGDLIVAEGDEDLNSVMSVMIQENIRHLPVAKDGSIVGMLSARDVIQAHIGKLKAEIHHLRDYITGG